MMSIARDLAEFFAPLDYADLPAQTTDYAAMLIASTFASAALRQGASNRRVDRPRHGARARRHPAGVAVVR